MKLDYLVIHVRSIEASLPWYETLLGLIGFAESREHVWINADGVAIDLKQARSGTASYERHAPGLNHLGFTAPDAAALQQVREGMAAAGFAVPEMQAFGQQQATFFRDPEGMRVEVTFYG